MKKKKDFKSKNKAYLHEIASLDHTQEAGVQFFILFINHAVVCFIPFHFFSSNVITLCYVSSNPQETIVLIILFLVYFLCKFGKSLTPTWHKTLYSQIAWQYSQVFPDRSEG